MSRHSGDHSSSTDTEQADPVDDFVNSPATWDSNSMQDAALFIVLNLAACSASRDYVYGDDVISILSAITEFQNLKLSQDDGLSEEQKSQQDFQCLKAVSIFMWIS